MHISIPPYFCRKANRKFTFLNHHIINPSQILPFVSHFRRTFHITCSTGLSDFEWVGLSSATSAVNCTWRQTQITHQIITIGEQHGNWHGRTLTRRFFCLLMGKFALTKHSGRGSAFSNRCHTHTYTHRSVSMITGYIGFHIRIS